MIDQPFRKQLPKYVEPLLSFYEKRGWTPNTITVLGMFGGFLASFFIIMDWYWLAILTWWISRIFDGTDGIYARKTGQSSALGAYLDISCDMAAYGAVILAFAISHPDLWFLWMLILFCYILCVTTALSLGYAEEKLAIGQDQNRGARLGAGLAEGGETGIAYTLFCLFPNYLFYLASLWLIILIITVVARTYLAKQVLAKR